MLLYNALLLGAAQCDIENPMCTHACANVSTTLGGLHPTMAATACAKMSATLHGGPTMLMRQPLRLTPAPIPVDVRTDSACDNASRRRDMCRGTYLLYRGSHD